MVLTIIGNPRHRMNSCLLHHTRTCFASFSLNSQNRSSFSNPLACSRGGSSGLLKSSIVPLWSGNQSVFRLTAMLLNKKLVLRMSDWEIRTFQDWIKCSCQLRRTCLGLSSRRNVDIWKLRNSNQHLWTCMHLL